MRYDRYYSVYNKIFTKILDSSIWLEPTPTRLVWLTFLAAMDEDGYAQFASVGNLAYRARISPEETAEAVTCLESPDPNSSDSDNEGRRIERVPGGWMILNAPKYRDLVTRTVIKEQTRARVAKHRQSKKPPCNAPVTQGNAEVTQSDTDTATHSTTASASASETKAPPRKEPRSAPAGYAVPPCFESVDGFSAALAGWIEARKKKRNPPTGRAIQILINRMAEQPARAVAALDAATEGGWSTVKWEWLDNARGAPKTGIRENLQIKTLIRH